MLAQLYILIQCIENILYGNERTHYNQSSQEIDEISNDKQINAPT